MGEFQKAEDSRAMTPTRRELRRAKRRGKQAPILASSIKLQWWGLGLLCIVVVGAALTYMFLFGLWELFVSPLLANPSFMDKAEMAAQIARSSALAMIASAVVGFLCFIISQETRKMRIAFDAQKGIGLGKSANPMFNAVIPWTSLKRIEIVKEYEVPVLNLSADDGRTHRIKWHRVLESLEPRMLVGAVRCYAPHAVQRISLPELLIESAERAGETSDEDNYTQLWLKYYSSGTDRKRTALLLPNDELNDGRYTIVGTVGCGGQGTAYLATDEDDESGKEIVLKEYILPLHRGNQMLEETIEKLQREAELLREISHPQIVTLHDCFIEDHRGYLAMEYVEGRTLRHITEREGPQPEKVVREIARQACEILSYLHSLSPPVVHRDVTPDNFIMQANGLIKLVDFNVAHQLESERTATVVGKQCYIPPEQFRGKPTIQSDIYALGCTLHFLLTGQDPEPISVSSPKQLAETISEELDDIVTKATQPDARRRYASVLELVAALSCTSASSS